MREMRELADPISPKALAAELRPEMRLRSYKGIDVYVTTAAESPAVMAEVGRIREREYRRVGAGRGEPRDIDEHDTGEGCYKQLVAWDPDAGEMVAMYRFIFGADAVRAGDISRLRTAGLFEFAGEFHDTCLSASVELGRSVVNREAKRAIAGLFVVWAGLGALAAEYPEIRYFFGNVSIYPGWPREAIDSLLAFLYEHYPPPAPLVIARPNTAYRSSGIEHERLTRYRGWVREDAFEALLAQLKRLGVEAPPILLSYMKATDAMAVFDTAIDPDFGGALETALWVPTDRLSPKTRKRFVESYEAENPQALRRYAPEPSR